MLRGLPNVRETKPGYFFFVKKIGGAKKYTSLPAPTDPKFAAAYAKAKAAHERPAPGSLKAGSFQALIAEYRTSADYLLNLSDETRTDYERYLAMIETEWGDFRVDHLKTSRIEKRRDEMIPTPGKANNWLKVLRTVLSLGVRRDYTTVNAADQVSFLKLGEHQPWPQEVIDRVLAKCPSPTTRLAIQTGLYSGQRISDVIRITHKMMEGDTVYLVQHKKRSKGERFIEVYIPIHPLWRAAVAAVDRRAPTIVYDRYGRPFKSPGALQERINDIMRDLGYVGANGKVLYTFHGLRKNSSNYLAEMGITDQQIGAINGMTLDTVRLYTRGVQKRILADAARERMLAGDVTRQASGITRFPKGDNSASAKKKKS